MLRLIEALRAHEPEVLNKWLDERIFVFANVPYRIKSLEAIFDNPKSTIIFDYLKEGESYNLKDFIERSSNALNLASERVMKKYGFRCTSAEAQLSKILANAQTFTPDQNVDCLSFE